MRINLISFLRDFVAARVFIVLLAGTGLVGSAVARDEPMRFSVFWPCSGNASFCAPRILAQGVITNDSAKRFSEFVEDTARHPHELPSAPTVVFDSPGGALLGAIGLGREIRRRGMSTEIADLYDVEDRDSQNGLRVIVNNAKCASACVLAFAGGVSRQMGKDARMGVHQFSSVAGQLGDGASQVAMVKLASYLEEMGVDRRLIDIAALVPSSEMAWLKLSQARELNLDNTSPPRRKWTIKAREDGTPSVFVIQPHAGDGKLVSALISHADDLLLFIVTAGFDQSLFSAEHLSNFPMDRPEIEICTERRCVQNRALGNWVVREHNGMALFTATMMISPDEAIHLSRASRLRIDDRFPSAYASLSVRTDFSVEGLGAGIALVMRSAGVAGK